MGQRKQALQNSRTAAKVGMAASLAALVYTGFKRGRKHMNLHTWAGMSLLGFTLWHVYLYQPKKRAAAQRHATARAAAKPAVVRDGESRPAPTGLSANGTPSRS